MKFFITVVAAFALLTRESAAQDARKIIPSLRAYTNELKVSSDGQQVCQLPIEAKGFRSWTECEDGMAMSTGEKVYFTKARGNNSKCVRGNGSARTNGSFSGVGTVDGCANKCVGKKAGSGFAKVQGFNYDCQAKTCQCLLGNEAVEETKVKKGSICYILFDMISDKLPAGNDDSICKI